MVLSLMEMDTQIIQKKSMEDTKRKGKARSIDSYRGTLINILHCIAPKHVFEWGPGISTEIMNVFPSVETVDSVEHSRKWVKVATDRKLKKVQYHYENMTCEYPFVFGSRETYDLIFVDGRLRPDCLKHARNYKMHKGSVVILHDSEREEYQEEINKFNNVEWHDDGHTVVLR